MTEKPTAIILPSWNPDEPRFIVETCENRIAEDREFRNNTCVFNQRLGFAYSVSEIVEVLNGMGDKLDKLEKENNKLNDVILGRKCNDYKSLIGQLKEENEQLKRKLQSVTMLKDDYEEYKKGANE